MISLTITAISTWSSLHISDEKRWLSQMTVVVQIRNLLFGSFVYNTLNNRLWKLKTKLKTADFFKTEPTTEPKSYFENLTCLVHICVIMKQKIKPFKNDKKFNLYRKTLYETKKRLRSGFSIVNLSTTNTISAGYRRFSLPPLSLSLQAPELF